MDSEITQFHQDLTKIITSIKASASLHTHIYVKPNGFVNLKKDVLLY